MRILGSIAAVVVGAGLSLEVLAYSPPAGASASRPILRALQAPAFGVRGAGYEPGERVAVTLFVLARPRETKRVVANSSGAFVARFSYGMPACTPWLVRAVGVKSGRTWYRPPVRDCSPK